MSILQNGVTPSTELLEAVRGFTFRCTITLYEDEAKTKPLPLGSYTIKLVIPGLGTLTSGNGLTINNATGAIAVKLTPVQTGAVVPAQLHYYLSLEENAEEIVPPVKGTIVFSNP